MPYRHNPYHDDDYSDDDASVMSRRRNGGDWAAAEEMAENLLERFSLSIRPWFRLKLRHVLRNASLKERGLLLGCNVCYRPTPQDWAVQLQLKPAEDRQLERKFWWRRLEVTTHGVTSFRSGPLKWGWWLWDFNLGYNWISRRVEWSYRFYTAWSQSTVVKPKFSIGKRVRMGTKFRYQFSPPSISMSSPSANFEDSEPDGQMQLGYGVIDVKAVDCTIITKLPPSRLPEGAQGADSKTDLQQQGPKSSFGAIWWLHEPAFDGIPQKASPNSMSESFHSLVYSLCE